MASCIPGKSREGASRAEDPSGTGPPPGSSSTPSGAPVASGSPATRHPAIEGDVPARPAGARRRGSAMSSRRSIGGISGRAADREGVPGLIEEDLGVAGRLGGDLEPKPTAQPRPSLALIADPHGEPEIPGAIRGPADFSAERVRQGLIRRAGDLRGSLRPAGSRSRGLPEELPGQVIRLRVEGRFAEERPRRLPTRPGLTAPDDHVEDHPRAAPPGPVRHPPEDRRVVGFSGDFDRVRLLGRAVARIGAAPRDGRMVSNLPGGHPGLRGGGAGLAADCRQSIGDRLQFGVSGRNPPPRSAPFDPPDANVSS